jgi:hypothetical protein
MSKKVEGAEEVRAGLFDEGRRLSQLNLVAALESPTP